MSTARFPEALAALLRPDAYPHPVESVRLVETHVSWVLLTGQLAYKIKRPVHLPFVDLRSPERRAFFCAEEVRLNQRFAAQLYLDVCQVVATDRGARMAEVGPVVDHAVRMRQFRTGEELDRLLTSGGIAPEALTLFGEDLADVHAGLPVAAPDGPWGHPDRVRATVLENLRQCADAAAVLHAREGIDALQPLLVARLLEAQPWLSARLRGGRVRECHGDLHAANVVRLQDRLVAFDAMEFEPAFRWIDVAEEIAFLTADLEAREAASHAHAFLTGYLTRSGDYAACRLLPLYQAHCALVRAKVAALRAAETGTDGEHARYVAQAGRALAEKQPGLVLLSGVSGSGKTWLARRLAPGLQAVHLRSDVERKRLPELRSYTPRTRAMVYLHLLFCAEAALIGGYTVLVDATFVRREDRAPFRRLAERLGVPLHVIACHAPPPVLRERIAERARAGTDPSEAGLEVLRMQELELEPITPDEELPVIAADTTRPDIVAEVMGRLRPGEPA